jgi:hypothetical protein
MAMRWDRSVKRNINRENPAVYWEVKIAKNDLPEMWGRNERKQTWGIRVSKL